MIDINEMLFTSVCNNNVELARDLVNQGANINGLTAYGATVWCDVLDYESAKLALELGADPSTLSNIGFNAARYMIYLDDESVMSLLQEAGADFVSDIDPYGYNLIHAAARAGSSKTLRFLVNNIPASELYLENRFGRIPLEEAELHGNNECAKIIRSVMNANAVHDRRWFDYGR